MVAHDVDVLYDYAEAALASSSRPLACECLIFLPHLIIYRLMKWADVGRITTPIFALQALSVQVACLEVCLIKVACVATCLKRPEFKIQPDVTWQVPNSFEWIGRPRLAEVAESLLVQASSTPNLARVHDATPKTNTMAGAC